MFKLSITSMNTGKRQSFEFNESKIAMSRFREHMDANNINDIDFYDDGFDEWFKNPFADGEYSIAHCGGVGHDVRIELVMVKSFSRIQENDIANINRVKGKLYQLGCRLVAINDDVHMEFWQFENRVFILQHCGNQFKLYCSMEFQSMESAFRQIENVCRIETFMA
jgi:hypothetical protein